MTEDVLCIVDVDTVSVDTVWTDPVELMIDSTILVTNNLGVEVEVDIQIPTGVFDSTMVMEVVCEEISDLIGYDTLVYESIVTPSFWSKQIQLRCGFSQSRLLTAPTLWLSTETRWKSLRFRNWIQRSR